MFAIGSVLILAGVLANRSGPKESAARAIAIVVVGLGLIVCAVYLGIALAG